MSRSFILCISLLLSLNCYSQTIELRQLNFQNLSVKEVLKLYQKNGFNVIFSDSFVSPLMTCNSNPEEGTPLQRLQEILHPFNLAIDIDSQTQEWFVVSKIFATPILSNENIPPRIEEILITASTYKNLNQYQPLATNIDNQAIAYSPSKGGDPVQIINTLPGMASSGISTKPYIRGGADDELLILLDGIELLDPFHLKDFQSLISGIDSNIVESMDIYSGGYPARYGNKMSGVMDITSYTYLEDYHNRIDWNLYHTSLKLSHELGENAHWIATLRRGNIDDVIQKVNPNIGAPRFNDSFMKIHWEPSKIQQNDFGYLNIRDDIKLQSLEENHGESANSLYNSQYAWVNTNYQHTPNNKSKLSLSFVNIKNNRYGYINEPNNPDESVGEVKDTRRFYLSRLNYINTSKIDQNQTIEIGAKLEHQKGIYKYYSQAQLGELATLIGNNRTISREIEIAPEGLTTHLYIDHQVKAFESLYVQSGIRLDTQKYDQHISHQVSPRLATRYTLTDDITLKASAGRFYQETAINQIAVEDGETDFQLAQKSDHYILGLEYDTTDATTLSFEVFSKDVFSPKARYENLFNPYSLLPEITADRIDISPDKSEIQGAECLLVYQPINDFKIWASYSNSQARDIKNTESTYRAWNQRHGLRAGSYLVVKNWTISSSLLWRSGWRTTQLPSTVTDLNNPINYEPNSTKMPSYFSFDIKASWHSHYKLTDIEAYIEVSNITNSSNIGFYEMEIYQNPNDNGYSLDKQAEATFPTLPSLGLSLRF